MLFPFPKEDDYDLRACLGYNAPGIEYDDIAEILHCKIGEPDSENWVWDLRLKDGTVGVLTGGCDYTGWDCQSWAEWQVTGRSESSE